MNASAMSDKERWMNSIDMKPVDRLIFWPKLDETHCSTRRWPGAVPSVRELYSWVGCDVQEWIPSVLVEKHPHSTFAVKTEGIFQTITYGVKGRELTMRKQFDPATMSWHPMRMPIKTVEDVCVMAEWFRDIVNDYTQEAVETAKAACVHAGEGSLWATALGESPLMYTIEWLAGIDTHYLLFDYRDEMEELFDAIHRDLLKKAEILCAHSPSDVIYMIENTSTTLINLEQYRDYCLRQVNEYGEYIRGSGKRYFLHMCGHLKALLPLLRQTNAHAFEAFTPPTLGDTTLTDGREGCPDKCFLGGTHAEMLISSADRVIGYLDDQLSRLPHHRGIVVTSGGMTPKFAQHEMLREVCEYVKTYPVRN